METSGAFGNIRNFLQWERAGHRAIPGKPSHKELFHPKCQEVCAKGSQLLFKDVCHGIFQRKSMDWKDAQFSGDGVGDGSEWATGHLHVCLSICGLESLDHSSPSLRPQQAGLGRARTYTVLCPAQALRSVQGSDMKVKGGQATASQGTRIKAGATPGTPQQECFLCSLILFS